jgi:hypothetical protein
LFFRKPQRNQKKRKIIRILVQNNRKYGHQSLTNSQSPFKRNWPINLEKKRSILRMQKFIISEIQTFPTPTTARNPALVGFPQGDTEGLPPFVRPSPPPWGWSTGFIATPRTMGRLPNHRHPHHAYGSIPTRPVFGKAFFLSFYMLILMQFILSIWV